MVGELKGHTDTIYALRFSRDGEILASGKITKLDESEGWVCVYCRGRKRVRNNSQADKKWLDQGCNCENCNVHSLWSRLVTTVSLDESMFSLVEGIKYSVLSKPAFWAACFPVVLTCCLVTFYITFYVYKGKDFKLLLFFKGSMDNTVRLWDAVKAFEDLETDDFTTATGHINLPENSQDLLLGTYMTKSTPVVHLHFTRRNLLLAAGAYSSQ